jgi:hypothetical protein
LRGKPAAAETITDPVERAVKTIERLEPIIKKFMPQVEQVADKVVNGRRPKWWETMLENAVPGFMEALKPFGQALAMKMMTPANGQPGVAGYAPVGPQPAQPQPGQPQIAGPATPPPQPPRLLQFLGQPLVMGALQSHFTAFTKDPESEAGMDFAYWIYTSGAGEQPLIDARAMGTTQILAMFRGSPAWPAMQPHEAKLTAFLDQVLSWRPASEEPPQGQDDEDETEDLTATM